MIFEQLFGLGGKRHTGGLVVTGEGVGQDSALRAFGIRPDTPAGVPVDANTPLTLSGWYAALRFLSWTMGSVPVKVYQRVGEQDRKIRRENAVWKLLHDRPNPNMTPVVYMEHGILSVIQRGHAISWIEVDVFGEPIALWPLPRENVIIGRFPAGGLAYDVSGVSDDDRPPNMPNVLAAFEVLDVPGMGGKSVVENARDSISESAASQNFAGSFYAGGGAQNLALEHPGKLTNEAKEFLRSQFVEVHGNQRTRGPIVLQENMKANVVGMPLRDAQFIESRQFYVTEAARWLGVPPHVIADLSHATFSNIAEENIAKVQGFLPWMKRFEEEWNWKLFTQDERDQGLFSEHMVDSLLAADPVARNAAFSTQLQNGYMSRNEVRAKLNMNSIGPEGDVFTIQSNLTTIEKIAADEPEPELDPIIEDPEGDEDDEPEDDETPPDEGGDEEDEPEDDAARSIVDAQLAQLAAKYREKSKHGRGLERLRERLRDELRTLEAAGIPLDIPEFIAKTIGRGTG